MENSLPCQTLTDTDLANIVRILYIRFLTDMCLGCKEVTCLRPLRQQQFDISLRCRKHNYLNSQFQTLSDIFRQDIESKQIDV